MFSVFEYFPPAVITPYFQFTGKGWEMGIGAGPGREGRGAIHLTLFIARRWAKGIRGGSIGIREKGLIVWE